MKNDKKGYKNNKEIIINIIGSKMSKCFNHTNIYPVPSVISVYVCVCLFVCKGVFEYYKYFYI